jgi:ferredoxin
VKLEWENPTGSIKDRMAQAVIRGDPGSEALGSRRHGGHPDGRFRLEVPEHGRVQERRQVSTEVYYFSGTGNSLAVAKDLARSRQATARPIAAFRKCESIATKADAIGVVFPAYMAHLSGVPLMVDRFIRKLSDIGSKYVFAVCTCGGHEDFNALPALRNLAKLVRSVGGRIGAEFSIRLPMNTLDYGHIPVPIDKDHGRMFQRCESKILEISQIAGRRGKSRYRIRRTILNWLMTPLYRMLQTLYYQDLRKKAREPADSKLRFEELVPLTDKSIFTDDKCQGCGTCAKVCPAGNIAMIEGKPLWQHHCEICLACVEWCPNKAIHHGFREHGKSYRHPRVKLQDMLEQAKPGGSHEER